MMKLKTVSLALALSAAFLARDSRAAEPAAQKPATFSESVMNWFKNWKQGLDKSAVEGRYRKVRTTAVAAVRGAKQEEDMTRPYWKGSISEKKAAESMAERKELAAAVDLVLAGKKEEAAKKLDAFSAAHPKSQYLADVRQAREKLSLPLAENH